MHYSEYEQVSKDTTMPTIVTRKEPYIGMSKEELSISTWGHPKKVNTQINKYGTSEQWVYDDGKYVYLNDDIVTGIQK